MRYVQEILNQILQGIQVTNIETYITLSEQIIDEVRLRNFSLQNEAAMDELQNATLCKLFWMTRYHFSCTYTVQSNMDLDISYREY